LDGLAVVVEALTSLVEKDYRIILLEGELGAGKTTLVKALCQEWGVMNPVSSPTFSLVQEYESPGQGTIYHMDFYRLDKIQDLEQIGLDEYLDSGNICLIEWPELGMPYFTMPHVRVVITPEKDNIRNLRITTNDAVDA
ncbi:MAG: tRNA (adenosine(37)-N6)-threonylcarbamoyltransferase complex ATPase subunit type 1 TsaE, partial [Saprospiraceae bacterium]